MEINNNFSIKTLKNRPAYKGNLIDFKTGKKIKSEDIPSVVNPEYYQSMYGIQKPSYKTTVLLKSGKRIPLEMDEDTITKYLSNDKGTPDVKLVKKFISLYGEVLQKMADRNKKETRLYKGYLKEEPNVSDFDSPFELFEEVLLNELTQKSAEDSYDFAKNVLSQISGYHKKEISKQLLDGLEEEKEILPLKAYNRTVKLFELSKTQNGYDFSNMEKKNEFANSMDIITDSFAIDDEDDLYAEFIENSKDENGNFDLDFAIDAAKVTRSLSFFETPKYVCSTVKHFVSKDYENKDAIINTITKFNTNTNYGMEEDSNIFETVMGLCFDKNNKYSQERVDFLFDKFKDSDEWILSNLDEDNDDYERYKTIIGYSVSMLTAYFDKITDNNGNLNPADLSFDDYAKSINVSFM